VLCICVALALVAKNQRWLAFAWVAAVVGNSVLNTTLKQVFERVRPLHEDGLVMAQGFSFPSGHSSGSVVAYGMLACVATRWLPRRWHLAVWIAAAATAFSVGASRVFLRVHFASDVLAGFASGTVWLAVCLLSVEFGRQYRRRPPEVG
jgi:membrane-associated phospholipid phosphatase